MWDRKGFICFITATVRLSGTNIQTVFKGTYRDSLQLELVVEGFEGGDVLLGRREVGGEDALEAGGRVVLPPHLPQAE